ncbi:MAG: SMP-30/gluconolactonase/LRE family protein, partial [Candidatus Binataceae bacterium]
IEGPRVDERNRLYFSDVPNGGVYRRSPDGVIETLIPRRRGVGGIALNAAGGIVCSGRSLICWDEATKQSRDLFTEWEGRALRGLNDLTVDAQGSVFVGSLEFDALSTDKPIPGNVFRVDPPNTVTKQWEGIEVTNGMGFSPDARLLYHCDSTTKAVWAYDVTADRRLKDRRVFGKLPEGWPDGMAVDVEGGVWVAVVRHGEVVRFKANGTMERRIKMPAEMVTSLCFGGADMMDLYVVTADNTEDSSRKGTIFRMRADVPGLEVPQARF